MARPNKNKKGRDTARHWKQDGPILHVRNEWAPIGRLFLAPFLLVGVALLGIGVLGIVMQLVRGRFAELMSELPVGLGMTAMGALLAVPCWMGVFSWYDAVLDGQKRTVKVEEGAWPWIKRWKEPVSAFRGVKFAEQDLMSDTDGGSSVSKQAVMLVWTEPEKEPHVLHRCDSYAEAEALSRAVSGILRIPVM